VKALNAKVRGCKIKVLGAKIFNREDFPAVSARQ
tara:strand:+ start:327 stop:428 length:102 start_codon:yes stop_codon:yes gene_type:complete